LPVGIKSAIGQTEFWYDLLYIMKHENRGPDFITIDGGEGGTGAAPAAFADHVSMPFDVGFSRIYKMFQESGIENRVAFIVSGKLGLPAESIRAFAMGADMINMAREILIANGCIQAQKCHTGNCPTLIASNKNQHRFNIEDKKMRVANFVMTLRKDILEITHALGYEHPCQIKMKDLEINTVDSNLPVQFDKIYGYEKSKVDFSGMKNLISQESIKQN
jgi:glutamate synthase domain-containing protein 2